MLSKNKYLSFINKGILSVLFLLLLIVIIPCYYLIFAYWSEMPILIKISCPFILIVTLIGIIMTLLNGMFITKRGTIFFVADFRMKKFNVKDLERVALNFNEWDNNKYSVMIRFIHKDGKFFMKDYSKQFRNMKNKTLAMSMYTINKRKVDRICKKLLDLDICHITILDKNRNIIYQKK